MWSSILACLLLVACKPEDPPPPVVTGTHADSAPQMAFGTQSVLLHLGVQQGTLVADTVFMFDDRNRFELRGVRVIFNSATGAKEATLTSREATYLARQGSMHARGNVVVITEDGRELRSPELRFDQNRNEISSDSVWTSVTPDGTGRGVGFNASPDLSRFTCRECSGRGIPGGL